MKLRQEQSTDRRIDDRALWLHNIEIKRVVGPGTFHRMDGPNSLNLKGVRLMVTDKADRTY